METVRLIDYAIDKLYELKIKAEIEDRQRKKKRYVSKVSAYKDLINLLEDIKEQNNELPKPRKTINRSKRKVICVETGVIYDSTVDAGKKARLSPSHISECCNGRRYSTGGYRWRYLDE